MNIIKTLFKDSFIYGISSYVNLLAAFILTPIYTRILSKESYGLMDLCVTWNNFFMLIIPLGLTAAMLRTYQDYKTSPKKKKENLGSLLSILLISNIVYCLGILILKEYIYLFYYKTNLDSRIYWLSMGIVNFSVLTNYFQTLNRVNFKKYTFLFINLIGFFILSILGFVLVYHYKFGILGFFIAGFSSNLVSLILSIFITKESLYFSFNKDIIYDSLKYSIPLLIVLIFMRFTQLIDRIIINSFIDLKTLGEYSIVIRVSSFFQIMISAFSTAWFPHAMNLLRNKDRNKTYNIAFNLYLYVFTILGCLVIFFLKEILLFLAPDYLNIINQIILIILVVIVGGTSHFFGLGLHVLKRSKLFIISSVLSFLVNIVSSIILARFYGINGIIIGSLLSTLTWVFTDYYNSYRIAKISFKYYRLFFCMIIILLFGFITINIDNLFALSVQLKFGTLLLFIIIIFFKRKAIMNKINLTMGKSILYE